jgi:hypothetical protein
VKQSYGEGEAQGSGEPASGVLRAATYRGEKGEERRTAGRHGGGVTAKLGGGAVRVAARERAGEPRDRAGEGIRQRWMGQGARGAALAGQNSRNGGGGGAENRGAEGLPEEEEGWRGAKDLIANYKNFKGLNVKLNFPLLQSSNGKKTKIENV